MRNHLWIVIAIINLLIGFVVLTTVGLFSPTRLIDEEKKFKYDVAVALLFVGVISLLAASIWLLTWPARRAIEKRVGIRTNATN